MNATVYQFPINHRAGLAYRRARMVPAQVITLEPRHYAPLGFMLLGFGLFWFGAMLAWSRW